jgi:hypothetical protein
LQGSAANRQLRPVGCDLQYLTLLPDGEIGQPFRGLGGSLEGRDVAAHSGLDDAGPFEL